MHDPFAEYGLAEPFIPSSFDCFPGMHLAGVDEVGRGPLVGAVVTAAVVLDPATVMLHWDAAPDTAV